MEVRASDLHHVGALPYSLEPQVRFASPHGTNENEQRIHSVDDMDVDEGDLCRQVDATRFVEDVQRIAEQLEWFFYGFANGAATVFIHGSFARRLATPTSDVNLYIVPYSRSELDRVWSRSIWRDFDTIEIGLHDLLKRPVTVSCHKDEPRFWVEQDQCMFPVWPFYQWQIPKKACVERVPFLENLIRKCWYEVCWHDICSKNPLVAEPLEACTVSSRTGAKRRRPDVSLGLLVSAISKLDLILQSASVEDWGLVRPEVHSILPLRDKIAKLSREVAGMNVKEQNSAWREVEERYEDCAAAISDLGAFVMPHIFKENGERELNRNPKKSRFQ